MRWRALLLALAAHFCASSGSDERPEVSTPLGRLRGVWMTSEKGEKYAAYLGVPFAQPPLGKLRFRDAVSISPWRGTWEADTVAPQCLTYDHTMHPLDTTKIKGHEDCLYLNIYAPERDKSLLPVIVFIHAGAFMFGTSNQYGAKFIADKKIILVTINYRVGPFGFLSFGDDALPGNAGLKDQVEALKWVQNYIRNFCGDPENVTIMGLSAGGSSVHYHYLSPLSRGLFSRGVSLSGTALCRWALAENVEEKSQRIASMMGCGEGGTEEKLDCLRERPAQNIVALVEHMQVWQYSPFSPLGPVVEKNSPNAFLQDTPINLLKSGNFARLPWITGVTESEGLYPAGTFVEKKHELERLDSEFDQLVPFLLDFNYTVTAAEMDSVAASIRKEYFGDEKIDRKSAKKIIKMISDRMFLLDAQNAARTQAAHSDVWFYQFKYRGEHSLSGLMTGNNKNYGASHADDISYVLNVTFIPHEAPRRGAEMQLQEQMLDLWSSFARTGAPEAAGVTWEKVDPASELLDHLLVDGAPSGMAAVRDLGNAGFWNGLPLSESSQSIAPTVEINPRDEL